MKRVAHDLNALQTVTVTNLLVVIVPAVLRLQDAVFFLGIICKILKTMSLLFYPFWAKVPFLSPPPHPEILLCYDFVVKGMKKTLT